MKPENINLKPLLYKAFTIGILLFMANMPTQAQFAGNSKPASTNASGVEYPRIDSQLRGISNLKRKYLELYLQHGIGENERGWSI